MIWIRLSKQLGGFMMEPKEDKNIMIFFSQMGTFLLEILEV